MGVRLLRGQVVVREELEASAFLWTPSGDPRETVTHRGRVLAKGPPALLMGHEVPHGFEVGDLVIFSWSHHEKSFSREWVDGEKAAWIKQSDVHAVVE